MDEESTTSRKSVFCFITVTRSPECVCVCVSERYRIQSDSFEDMWLLVTELLRRFDQHFSKLGVKDFRKSFSGPLPLQDYFRSMDQHFQVSAASAGVFARKPRSSRG